ncbi:MAG: hypothetical protein RL469_1339 [Pseudomonadota bacterium]|jgi:3-hydroxyacyl-CoA dehydrogenase
MESAAPISRIALVGAGLVGASWAVVFARSGLAVRVYDLEPARLPQARMQVSASLDALLEAALLTEPAEIVAGRITWCDTLESALEGADYVQESIAEDVAAKRELFARLDAMATPQAVLASSTSAFPTSAFAGGLAGERRCLVVHPVNPPHLIPYVELCGSAVTAPETIDTALRLMQRVGQSPVHVREEVTGFLLNRLQWSLLAEACRLVAAGVVSPDAVDRALRDGLGRRWAFMGPFEVGDLNAPGGLGDYLRRFRPTIEAIDAASAAQPLQLDESLIAQLDADAQQRLRSPRDVRIAAREQRLLSLAKALRDA